jgi:hypothetical protein
MNMKEELLASIALYAVHRQGSVRARQQFVRRDSQTNTYRYRHYYQTNHNESFYFPLAYCLATAILTVFLFHTLS